MAYFEVEPDVGHRLLAPRIAYLIGTYGVHGPNLIPVSNVTAVSRKPQVLVISVYKEWETYHNLRGATGFTLCVPTVDNIDAVWRLGSKYSGFEPPAGASKLSSCGAEIDLKASSLGPVLADGAGWMECEIVQEAGIESDHGIFFGRVRRVAFESRILTAEGQYLRNSRPVMQVVKNSFSTSEDHWEIPYFRGPG